MPELPQQHFHGNISPQVQRPQSNSAWHSWACGPWQCPAGKSVTGTRNGSSAEILDNIQGLDEVQGWTWGYDEDKIHLGAQAQDAQCVHSAEQSPSPGKGLQPLRLCWQAPAEPLPRGCTGGKWSQGCILASAAWGQGAEFAINVP